MRLDSYFIYKKYIDILNNLLDLQNMNLRKCDIVSLSEK